MGSRRPLPARPKLRYLTLAQRLCDASRVFREALMRDIGHFIGGKRVAATSGRSGDVFNPNTGEVQAKVAFASKAEVEEAIANAEAAQPACAAINPQRR